MGGQLKVRSPALLALSLSLLGSAGALGILVHDAELGATLADEAGEEVRLKGPVAPLDSDAAKGLQDDLATYTVQIASDDVLWLLTSAERLPQQGTWIFDGEVVLRDGARIVVSVLDVTSPLLFA